MKINYIAPECSIVKSMELQQLICSSVVGSGLDDMPYDQNDYVF